VQILYFFAFSGMLLRVYNEELNDLYSSLSNLMDRACSAYGGGKQHVQGFGGET
jgi:hypothetical protein